MHEHLVEDILDFAIVEDKITCQQNIWNDDGDPLFDTSSIESDHNLKSHMNISIVDWISIMIRMKKGWMIVVWKTMMKF